MALASIASSTLLPAQTLVSDDSDPEQADQTAAVCAAFAAVTYLRGPCRGLSANRNHCLDHLAPKIVAVTFIDDDVQLRSNFLQEIWRAQSCAAPGTIMTGGEYKNGTLVTPHNCSFWGHQEVSPRSQEDYHTVVINAALFPRRLFNQARFDEALRYGSEEADICAQAEALGYQIQYVPDLCNDHFPSPINREEYAPFVEASRLYSTYKRYRWLEKSPVKAALFAIFAPLHLLVSLCKRRRIYAVPAAVQSLRTAFYFASQMPLAVGSE